MDIDNITQQFKQAVLDRLPGLREQNLTVTAPKDFPGLQITIALNDTRCVSYRQDLSIVRAYRGPLADIVDEAVNTMLSHMDPEAVANLETVNLNKV